MGERCARARWIGGDGSHYSLDGAGKAVIVVAVTELAVTGMAFF